MLSEMEMPGDLSQYWKVMRLRRMLNTTATNGTAPAPPPAAAKGFWNPAYFHETILNRSENIQTMGSLQGWLVFCLFLSYFLTYFSSWKGLKSTGKMVWITCTAPYVILTILLCFGLSLEGMGKGLHYLFVPEWKNLGDSAVWEGAAV